jgi:hypothetical protein
LGGEAEGVEGIDGERMESSRSRLFRRINRFASLVATAIAAMSATACVPFRYPCEVITLDHPEAYTVSSRYSAWSAFSTECAGHVPQELLIRRKSYTVDIYLHANPAAQVYLGVQPFHSTRFALSGSGLRELLDVTAFSDRATHMFRQAWSPNGRLEFQVIDRESGSVDSFSFGVAGSVRCTCKVYDGP